MTTLADRIKTERKRLKLSQADLAKRVSPEMGQSFISMLETGNRLESPYLPELANIFGVDALWLKTGKGNRSPHSSTYQLKEPATVLSAQESSPSNLIAFPSPKVSELLAIANRLSDEGIIRLIERAEMILEKYPKETSGNAAG